MEYYKIHSLWKRNGWYFDQGKKQSKDYQEGKQSFIEGDFAESEFSCIKNWRVTEKIDGTNIRIEYNKDKEGNEKFTIKGRTENAQIPPHLLNYLQETFTIEKIRGQFPDAQCVRLFGEGIGPKIQEPMGSMYSDVPSFVLFDVLVGGWVLHYSDVKGISESLGIDCTPDLGIMTHEEIIEYVKSQPMSKFSKYPQVMEGIVATPEPVMMYRKGGPIKMKLKCKEYRCLKAA